MQGKHHFDFNRANLLYQFNITTQVLLELMQSVSESNQPPLKTSSCSQSLSPLIKTWGMNSAHDNNNKEDPNEDKVGSC